MDQREIRKQKTVAGEMANNGTRDSDRKPWKSASKRNEKVGKELVVVKPKV